MGTEPKNPYGEVKLFYDLMQNLDERNRNKRMKTVVDIAAQRKFLKKVGRPIQCNPEQRTKNRLTRIPVRIKREGPVEWENVKSTKGWLHGVNIGERVWVDDKLYEAVNVKSNTSTLKVVEPNFFQWIFYLIKKIGRAVWKSL